MTATDPGGEEASDTFVASVLGNAAPIVATPLPDVVLGVEGEPLAVALGPVFTDPDGEELVYTCTSSNPAVAEASGCEDGLLSVIPEAEGEATIEVRARDPHGAEVVESFLVSVGCTAASVTDVSATPALPEAGQDVTVEVVATGGVAAALRYRRGGEETYTETAMGTVGGGFRATLPGAYVTERGVEFRVEVEGACGSPVEAGMFALRVRVPGGVVSPALPASSGQGGYRIVSVPLDPEAERADAVLDAFGEAGDAWRAFHLLPPGVEGDRPADGAEDQWYLDDPAAIELEPGRAFWLVTRRGGRFNTGVGTTLPSDGPFEIGLHRGWNLIGTPFGHDVPLGRVRLESGAPVQLHAYEGAWRPETEHMQPFHGYALRLISEDRLIVEPAGEQARPAPSEQGPLAAWSIGISASIGAARDDHNRALTHPNAQDGHDALDWFEPPVVGAYVSVAFARDEGAPLAVDARPISGDGMSWPFEVQSNLGGRVSLGFDGLDGVPPAYVVWIIDDAAGMVYDLREKKSLEIASPAGGEPSRLRLVVGTEEYVRSASGHSSAVPTEYRLGQGFPNPFRSVVTIPFSLPRTGPATLEVFDALGRSVATLVEGHVEAGHHSVLWDAGAVGVASGAYVVRLRAGDFAAVQRLVLLR